jgi:uncharacterized protein YjdB
VVTGVKAGRATITVTTADSGKTASCNVTVSVAVSGVTLNKSSASLFVRGKETLYATITPSDATNQIVTWSSSNTSIATVTASSEMAGGGVVTAVAAGTATITVTTADGGKTATCTVTVSSVAVDGVTLNKTSASLFTGDIEILVSTITPSNATNQNVTWSSSNTSVARVGAGFVIAGAEGTATITVTTVDGGKTATCIITVSDGNVPVTGVTLNKTSASLLLGGTETLTPTITPSDATNRNVTWDSSNTSVATVTAGGVVTAVGAGTATVTVTTANGGKTADCTVTVNTAYVTFNSVTADGSAAQATTRLTLTFSRAIAGLSADDITLSPALIKGTLGGSGPVYTLPISGFTVDGTLNVAVGSPSGYSVSGSPKTVTIYYGTGTGTETLAITFTQIIDAAPFITGPTLYRVSNGGPTGATLTVVDPGQYDSIAWRVQDTAVTVTGPSFTLSAGNTAYNLIGEHFVTVLVMKGGAPYNKTVSFKVEY